MKKTTVIVCNLIVLAAVNNAKADSLIVVTSTAAQGASDSIAWGQLGADSTLLPAAFNAATAAAASVTVTLTGANSVTSLVCPTLPSCSWTGAGFPSGDSLLWTSDAGNAGNGPLKLTFGAGIAGAGALLQADGPGQFTAKIEAFNGASSLGSFTVTSNANGDATYIGVKDTTAANITSVTFSLTSGVGNLSDFAIDTVFLNKAAAPQPLSITGPAALPAGTVNQAYPSTTITATGGMGSYTWSATGLPVNLGIAPGTGIISGTPNSSGTFNVTVKVTDSTAATATKAYSLVINQQGGGGGVLLAIGSGSAAPGQSIEVSMQLTTQSGNMPALCAADVSFDPLKLSYVSARMGEQLTNAGKSLTALVLPNNDVRILGAGINTNTIGNGNWAYITLKLNSQFTTGNTTVTLKNCQSSDAQSVPLTTTCTAGTIAAGCSCDANGDGVINVSDIQFIINQFLTNAASMCHGGSVNVADIQRVINAFLGLGCS